MSNAKLVPAPIGFGAKLLLPGGGFEKKRKV